MSWDGFMQPPTSINSIYDQNGYILDRSEKPCDLCWDGEIGEVASQWKYRHNGSEGCWYDMDGIGPWTELPVEYQDSRYWSASTPVVPEDCLQLSNGRYRLRDYAKLLWVKAKKHIDGVFLAWMILSASAGVIFAQIVRAMVS